MRVLVATDAWHPQVNGVVRTLTRSRAARKPRRHDRFPVAGRISDVSGADLSGPAPGAAEPATDRAPHRAGRAGRDPRRDRRTDRLHGARLLPQARTAVHHELHDAISRIHLGALADPESWIYAALRRFHAAAAVTMVATPSLMTELGQRGFTNLGMWTRGVDTDLFRPDRAIDLGFPRPIFVSVGRVAVEKNLEAFLSLDLPGTKVVIGTGPQEAELRRRFPGGEISRTAGERNPGRASGGGRRLRISKPHRHVRRRAARSAGERRSGRCLSGHRSEGRGRRQSDRRAERRPARGLPGRASDFPRSLPRIRAGTLVGEQRASIHRARPEGGRQAAVARRASRWRQRVHRC